MGTTQKLVELSNGSSISIDVSELNASSSIPCSNVVSHVADSCLEGYLVGEMVINEENNDRIDELSKIVDSSTLPLVTATEMNIDNNSDHNDVVTMSVGSHRKETGARVVNQPISEILKGFKFM